MKFAKFLRTPVSKNVCERLLLQLPFCIGEAFKKRRSKQCGIITKYITFRVQSGFRLQKIRWGLNGSFTVRFHHSQHLPAQN